MKIDQRLRIWAHNGLLGSLAMAGKFVERVISLDSTTPEAKQIAANMRPLLNDLHIELKKRVDPC